MVDQGVGAKQRLHGICRYFLMVEDVYRYMGSQSAGKMFQLPCTTSRVKKWGPLLWGGFFSLFPFSFCFGHREAKGTGPFNGYSAAFSSRRHGSSVPMCRSGTCTRADAKAGEKARGRKRKRKKPGTALSGWSGTEGLASCGS